jgi:6-pyruvoyltetrahydropterin/6-carboxytetrahydropterin synthase
MKTKIAKEFKWEMSHRLPFHSGPCRNLHGHSYKLIIELEGEPDEFSMVLDYYEIDKIVQPLLKRLDHAFICDKDDKLMIDFLGKNNFKFLVMPYFTTSENLVTYFIDEIQEKFKTFKNIYSLTIRVFETIDAYAERTVNLK